jgi:flagellar basal-body rod protein FlgB
MDLPTSDKMTSLLTSFLDVQSRRSEIVAGNIANADTPGFHSKALDFGDYLEEASVEAVTRPGSRFHEAPTDLPTVVLQGGLSGIDGNDVDVQREMANLSDAGMQYLTGVQMLQSRLRTLRSAIKEGR